MRHRAWFGIALLALGVVARGQQPDFSKTEMKTTHVAGNVYLLQGEGGNIGVSAGPDGVLIVDDEFAPLAEKIQAAMTAINPGKLKFVINTHFHGDHTGSNPYFGRQAPIIAQANVRIRLGAGKDDKREGLPVVTFNDTLSVHFNGEEIKLLHVPHGHTDSDSLIFFTKSNVVHMGDDFFAGRFPFVDLESGGSVQGMTAGVEKVLAQIPADAKVIPGHGPLSDVNGLKAYHHMLVATTAIVQKQIKAKKTLAQIQAEGLPAEWKEWGSGFIDTKTWIETIYNSLTKKMPDHPVNTTHH